MTGTETSMTVSTTVAVDPDTTFTAFTTSTAIHVIAWIEFRVGNCSPTIFKLDGEPSDTQPVTHEPWVYVDDLDAHLTRVRAGGHES